MTLVIALANADQIIQVSDRRLSVNGKIVDDSSNKAGYIICNDAVLVYSYTGLASYGNHKTSKWLLYAFNKSTSNGNYYRNIVDCFVKVASDYFCSSNMKQIPLHAKRLSIMITGYTCDGYIVSTLISNFQDFVRYIDYPEANPEFKSHMEISCKTAEENPTLIQVIGQFNAFTENYEKNLRKMLVQRAPAEAIRQSAAAIVRNISCNHNHNNSVGRKINTVRLTRTDPTVPVSGYLSDMSENTFYLVDHIDLRSNSPIQFISTVKISAEVPLVFPKVHRSAPCPCGSGLKYRRCHGRRHR